MTTPNGIRKLSLAMMLAFVPMITSACGDDSTEPDNEPQVHTIRLQVGSATVNFVSGNPAAVTLARGPNAVSATFLKANGQPETLVNATEHELQFNNLNGSLITFTRTGAFTGTLTGVAAGATTMTVCLFHKEEQHCDVTVTNIPVTLQ